MNAILAASESAGQRPLLLATAYERHSAELTRYISTDLLAGDRDQSEDLAADVWLRVLENLDRVGDLVLELAWLREIAHSVVKASPADGLETLVGFTGDEPELAATHTGRPFNQSAHLYTDLSVSARRSGRGTNLAGLTTRLGVERDEVWAA